MGLKDKLTNAKTTDWLTKDISDLELKQIRDLSLISAAIELRRKDLGMNQKQFASFMGVSQAMISKWESGASDPSTTNLIALAKLYKIEPEELIRSIME